MDVDGGVVRPRLLHPVSPTHMGVEGPTGIDPVDARGSPRAVEGIAPAEAMAAAEGVDHVMVNTELRHGSGRPGVSMSAWQGEPTTRISLPLQAPAPLLTVELPVVREVEVPHQDDRVPLCGVVAEEGVKARGDKSLLTSWVRRGEVDSHEPKRVATP